MSELEHALDMLAWLTAMHRAAWAIVRAYEQSGSQRPEKIDGALLELDAAREMLAAQL